VRGWRWGSSSVVWARCGRNVSSLAVTRRKPLRS